jgi:hypothetical protein
MAFANTLVPRMVFIQKTMHHQGCMRANHAHDYLLAGRF